MACTTEYIEFVCSQLQGAGVIRALKMFGDWCIYIDEKPIILACDNLCYVKKHLFDKQNVIINLREYQEATIRVNIINNH